MKYTSRDIGPIDLESLGETDIATEVMDTEETSDPGLEPIKAYTPLQMDYLARLKRLDEVRVGINNTPDVDPFVKKLVDRGLFATHQECLDAGLAV